MLNAANQINNWPHVLCIHSFLHKEVLLCKVGGKEDTRYLGCPHSMGMVELDRNRGCAMSTAPKNFINKVYVTKAFQSLKLKSPSGPDGSPSLPLKYAAKELSAVFTDLFQLSISTGVLPDSWRTTRITPLPKK